MAACEAGGAVANVAVCLLDGEGQIFAGEQAVRRDAAVKALPVIANEYASAVVNLRQQLL